MKWIYSSGTEKKRPPPKMEPNPKAGGSSFFSSLFSSLSGVSTPHRVSTPTPLPIVRKVDQRAINETSVSLSIYSASVQVRLTKQLSSEIHRSTKKNPPARTKFELIYVSFSTAKTYSYEENLLYRRQLKMNMMQAWKKTPNNLKPQEASSRGYVQMLKGAEFKHHWSTASILTVSRLGSELHGFSL